MRSVMAFAAVLWAGGAAACSACRPLVMARISAEPFWPTALMLAVPAIVLVLLALTIHRGGSSR